MAKKYKKYDKIEVEWIDSEGDTTHVWHSEKDLIDWAKSPSTVQTIGYYFGEYNGHLVVIKSYTDTEYGQPLKIPTVAIKKVKKL